MSVGSKLNKRIEKVTWGLLFVWWGITEMAVSLPEGAGPAGVGLILLGLNAARALTGLPANGFSVFLGTMTLLWGGLEAAPDLLNLPFKLPVFAILLVAFGAFLIARVAIRTGRQSAGKI